MKKSVILIIWLCIMVCNSFCYQLEIGNGSEQGQHLPCDPFCRHSGSQLIYDNSYFPYVGTITQISFQYHFSSDNPEEFVNDITLMIGEDLTNSFQDGDDFIDLNLLTTCFEGNLTATNFQASDNAGNGLMVIDLTEAYLYYF